MKRFIASALAAVFIANAGQAQTGTPPAAEPSGRILYTQDVQAACGPDIFFAWGMWDFHGPEVSYWAAHIAETSDKQACGMLRAAIKNEYIRHSREQAEALKKDCPGLSAQQIFQFEVFVKEFWLKNIIKLQNSEYSPYQGSCGELIKKARKGFDGQSSATVAQTNGNSKHSSHRRPQM